MNVMGGEKSNYDGLESGVEYDEEAITDPD